LSAASTAGSTQNGLGLFVARACSRAQGGDLTACAAPTAEHPTCSGTLLQLRVPVCIPPAAAAQSAVLPEAAGSRQALKRSASAALLALGGAASSPPMTPAPQLRSRAPRAMLIDDHRLNLKLVRRLLERHGFEVSTAVDGADGLAQLQASLSGAPGAPPRPDIVLCDLMMPVLNGCDMARQLRAWEAATQPPDSRLLVLALSANVAEEQVAECRDAGMDGHLSKVRLLLRRLCVSAS
jgi:CheY-like chemotaxis protein